jgi:hypothetical protein
MTIGVRRSLELDVADLVAASQSTLTAPLQGDAELWLARPSEEATIPEEHGLLGLAGGPPIHVGPGSLWVAFLLPRPEAMVPCDEPRIVNRYVRPLMRAMTKRGALAHYFGRDWISVGHRPAAWVGYAHDPATQRTTLEAVVAASTPFAVEPWPSFRGKEHGTLESIMGKAFDVTLLANAVVASYSDAYGRAAVDLGALEPRLQHR